MCRLEAPWRKGGSGMGVKVGGSSFLEGFRALLRAVGKLVQMDLCVLGSW